MKKNNVGVLSSYFFFSKTNGDVAGVLRLTFDEFLCFREEEEEEDGK